MAAPSSYSFANPEAKPVLNHLNTQSVPLPTSNDLMRTPSSPLFGGEHLELVHVKVDLLLSTRQFLIQTFYNFVHYFAFVNKKQQTHDVESGGGAPWPERSVPAAQDSTIPYDEYFADNCFTTFISHFRPCLCKLLFDLHQIVMS